MPPRTAQQLATGCLGQLGRFGVGRRIIQFMGHMQPEARLALSFRDTRFPSRVGLCAGLDSQARAVQALDQFGLAFIEYGPLTIASQNDSSIDFDPEQESIRVASPEQNPGLAFLGQAQRERFDTLNTPVFIRFDERVDAIRIRQTISDNNPGIAGYVVPWRAASELRQASEPGPGSLESAPLILALTSAGQAEQTAMTVEPLVRDGLVDGILIDGSLSIDVEDGGHRLLSKDAYPSTLAATRYWRGKLKGHAIIIAAGGLHQPSQAHELLRAGADVAGVDSGMVFAGPGLAKRSNELVAQLQFPPASSARSRPPRESWFWSLLMGVSMLGGGLLALVIGLTRVVLPYDESMVGMTREQLLTYNDRLLDFMAHDRVTLAGTMLSVGTLYGGLSWFGARAGAHWAQQTVIWSAFVGFFSFFLFLGFGYFDPFHAFVTSILFQFLLLTMYARLAPASAPVRLDPVNDQRWKWALWGQLMFLLLGAALILAGTAIAQIGISRVFVAEDLEFLCTTPERLFAANPQLIALVAHDRATFGGMLLAAGVAVLLSSLWGFRRGHAWLWWTLVIGGSFGFSCTIWIHIQVGYTSLKHLLPAYGGLLWMILAAGLCYGYLHDRITDIE